MKKLLLLSILFVGCEENAPTEHFYNDGTVATEYMFLIMINFFLQLIKNHTNIV